MKSHRTTFRFEWDNSDFALTDESVRIYNVLATIDYTKGDEITIDEIQLDIWEGKKPVFLDALTKEEQLALHNYAHKKADWIIWNGDL